MLEMEDIDLQIKESPLSKEESRLQFIEMTEQLGIQHSFSFDEAWEVGEELRRRKAHREKVAEFQRKLQESPRSVSGEELLEANPLVHSFADGMYVREIINAPGQVLVTKIHKKKHPFFLLYGEMSILTDNGVEHLVGPHYGITSPGTKRVIFTHTECKFVTVHLTDETDIPLIEEQIIAKDFDDPEITAEDIELLTGGVLK